MPSECTSCVLVAILAVSERRRCRARETALDHVDEAARRLFTSPQQRNVALQVLRILDSSAVTKLGQMSRSLVAMHPLASAPGGL